MNLKDAKFIVDRLPTSATDIVVAALKAGDPMWKVFMGAGLIEAIRPRISDRRHLLDQLTSAKNQQDAKVVLDAVLDSLKTEQIEKLIVSEKNSHTLLKSWMERCHRYEKVGDQYINRFDPSISGIDMFLGALKQRGVDVNPTHMATGKRGSKYEASIMSSYLADYLYARSGDNLESYVLPAIETLVKHGAKLDSATISDALRCGEFDRPRLMSLVTELDARGLIEMSNWIKEPPDKAQPENIALIQGLIAKQNIEKVMQGKRAAPGA